MEDITHQQRQAFKRIELIAQWEGRLNTNHLTEKNSSACEIGEQREIIVPCPARLRGSVWKSSL